jgi:hypothetical protein
MFRGLHYRHIDSTVQRSGRMEREYSIAMGVVDTISLISSLGDLLNKLAQGLSKFGDSIAHLTKLGKQGYDTIAAAKAHSELTAIRSGLGILAGASNIRIIQSLNEYVEAAKELGFDAELNWKEVIKIVKESTDRVDRVLSQVNQIRSDFVNDDAFPTIQSVLYGRALILEKLSKIPPPVHEKELAALTKAASEYEHLMKATQKASSQLAAYIKKIK